MANTEYPPRRSSRFVPGIYVNVDVGVNFSGRTHGRSIEYTSRHMQERLYRQQQETYYRDHEFAVNLALNEYENYVRIRDHQQEQQRWFGVRSLEQHERGSSAPPASMNSGDDIVSPIVSPLSADQSRSGFLPYRPSQHSSTFPQDIRDRPLPHTPATFRLGDEDLPWNTPPWFFPEPAFTSPIIPRAPPTRVSPQRTTPPTMFIPREIPSLGFDSESRRDSSRGREPTRKDEDPQRARELDQLQQAMMTVDTFNHDGQESWNWEDGPRSISQGPSNTEWAVSSDNSPVDSHHNFIPSPPPVFNSTSQWEQATERIALRPRTSG